MCQTLAYDRFGAGGHVLSLFESYCKGDILREMNASSFWLRGVWKGFSPGGCRKNGCTLLEAGEKQPPSLHSVGAILAQQCVTVGIGCIR